MCKNLCDSTAGQSSNRSRPVAAFAAFLIIASAECHGTSLGKSLDCALARDGATPYVIMLARDATPPERHAAEELAGFLAQVTGATFPIKTPEEAGTAPRLAVGPGAAKALEPSLSLEGLGADGIVIRQLPSNGADPSLILTGGPGALRGTLYAVYTFLEDQVGCRWWTKTESVIPKKPTLALVGGLDVRYVPPIWRREQSSWEGLDADWIVRNKLNGGDIAFAKHGSHTFSLLVPPAVHFEKHPEWFAEVNGKRVPEGAQLCLTNPEVLQAAVQAAREWLRAQPKAKLISITQNDNTLWCTCAKCKAVDDAEGSHSGTNLRFANAVAEALEKEFPDVLIDTFAYQYTRKPPKLTKPRDNVIVRLCSIECDFAHPLSHPKNKEFREDLEGWAKISKQLLIWDYVTNFGHYLQAHPNLRVLGPNIRFFRDYHVKGIYEQGDSQSVGGFGSAIKNWMIAKLLWNPDLDNQKLLQEFLDGYYGPAAPHLRAYLDLIHDEALLADFTMTINAPSSAPYLAPEILAKSAALFEKARAYVAGQPELLRRVEIAEMAVRYSQIVNGFDEVFQKGSVSDPDAVLAKLDRFEAIARREQITNVAEGGLLSDWVKFIRCVVSGKSLPQTAWTVKLPKGEVAVVRLGAAWKFASDPEKVGEKDAWFADKFDDTKWATNRTDLNCGWERQGFPGYVGFGWYRQRFDLPKEFGRKHLYLHFGAIDEEGWIYLNGEAQPVFEHSLATTKLMPAQIWIQPFFFETTGKLRTGASNLLTVRVYNSAFQGGIWRPVYVLTSDSELTLEDVQEAIKQEPKK